MAIMLAPSYLAGSFLTSISRAIAMGTAAVGRWLTGASDTAVGVAKAGLAPEAASMSTGTAVGGRCVPALMAKAVVVSLASIVSARDVNRRADGRWRRETFVLSLFTVSRTVSTAETVILRTAPSSRRRSALSGRLGASGF